MFYEIFSKGTVFLNYQSDILYAGENRKGNPLWIAVSSAADQSMDQAFFASLLRGCISKGDLNFVDIRGAWWLSLIPAKCHTACKTKKSSLYERSIKPRSK